MDSLEVLTESKTLYDDYTIANRFLCANDLCANDLWGGLQAKAAIMCK